MNRNRWDSTAGGINNARGNMIANGQRFEL